MHISSPALVLLAALHSSTALPIPDGSLSVTQHAASTTLAFRRHGHIARLTLPAEDGIYAGSLGGTQIVGSIPGKVLVLTTDYGSRPNGGALECGAGTETMLRVIVLQPALRQSFSQLVASCWQSIDAGDIDWNAATDQLSVERTTYDPAAAHDTRTLYQLRPDGSMTVLRADNLP